MKRKAIVDLTIQNYKIYCSPFTFKLQKGIPGHQQPKEGFVDCYCSPKKYKLIYLHIDKCGSTSLTTHFRIHSDKLKFVSLEHSLKDRDHNLAAKYFTEQKYTFFSLTRDPVKRWISGLNEFICRYNPPMDWVIKHVKDKKYIYDEHTSPQVQFLHMCTDYGGNLKVIKMEGDVSDKLNNFFKNNLSDNSEEHFDLKVPHLRQSKNFIPNYTSICKKIYSLYIEPDPEEFYNLYKEDFKLYKNGI